jgi:alkaline phosphatase D
VDGLRPGATYGYAVTADNDANAADPFSATFTTAPEGRAAFRFTSFGDLATPETAPAGSNGPAAYAVGAVETFQPLFHLLNGDLAHAGPGQGGPGHGAPGHGAPGQDGLGQPVRAQAWRDFGNNVQASAANRPWLPVPASHEPEAGDGEQWLASYLTRYTLPPNEADGFAGRWYAFRVGTALFVCLSGDDVAFSGAGGPGAGALGSGTLGAGTLGAGTSAAGTSAAGTSSSGTLRAGTLGSGSSGEGSLGAAGLAAGAPGAEAAPLPPDPQPGSPPVAAGTARYLPGYSGGAQTRWLESTLAAARADASIDWIIVQLHQCACSSAPAGGGSDRGVRQEWLPLFDTYEVDLVLSGHDVGYERSFPVRGFDSGAGTDTVTGAVADTRRPRPVTVVDSGVFDTSQGTVHLVLGGGGDSDDNQDPDRPTEYRTTGYQTTGHGPADYGLAAAGRVARVFTRPAPPVPGQRAPGGDARPTADAVEVATWSARRDSSAGYGIAVFDVSPGSEAGGQTSITVRYYHAVGADPVSPAAGDYTLFETFTLVRPRSDGRRWHPKG